MRRHSLRFRLIPALLFALSVVVSTLAQEFPAAKPESVGLSSERLDRIGSAVQHSIDDKRIAGAVTLVIRHGQVAYYKAQGMSDREASKPMPRDAIFRICSMSKPITSVAAMILYEEGKFLLDDPISKYLPEFKNPKVLVKPANGKPYTIPASREVTVRDLMRHTSGITYNWNEDLGQGYTDAKVAHGILQYDGTIGDSVKNLAAQPLLFNPGDKWEYSLGIDVLGRLIEVWSGKSFDEFLRTRIFEPLAMNDTYFFVPDAKVPRIATAYTYYADKGLNRFPDSPIVEGSMIYSADYPYKGPKKLFAGGAGLTSTAMDYARFAQMILNGGKLGNARILSRKTVELMSHDQLGKIAPDMGFGIGFGISGAKGPLDELGSVGDLGWGGFFYTTFSIDKKEDMIVVFMAQLHPAGDLRLDREVEVLAEQSIND
ncbi:MAG: serine hydrolase domain-containing protein [Candidatus Acidiferrum sp.]